MHPAMCSVRPLRIHSRHHAIHTCNDVSEDASNVSRAAVRAPTHHGSAPGIDVVLPQPIAPPRAGDTSYRRWHTSSEVGACGDMRMWPSGGTEHCATRSDLSTGPVLVRSRRATLDAASPLPPSALPRRRILRRAARGRMDEVFALRTGIRIRHRKARGPSSSVAALARDCATSRLGAERRGGREPLFRAR